MPPENELLPATTYIGKTAARISPAVVTAAHSFESQDNLRCWSENNPLTYFESFVEWEAKRIINEISLEGKNYDIALKMLQDTYGDEDEYIRLL
jgi:hypothetical protein